MWIPSHVGIAEHDKADKAAKAASSAGIQNILTPTYHTEAKNFIFKSSIDAWNHKWKNIPNLKLHNFKTSYFEENSIWQMGRRS